MTSSDRGASRAGLWASILAVLLVAGVAGTAWWWFDREASREAGAEAAITAYLAGWQAKDMSGVAFAEPGAAEDFAATFAGLGDATVKVTAGEVRRDDATADTRLQVAWTLPGGEQWTYAVAPTVVERGTEWVVAAPATGSRWHPNLPAKATVSLKTVDPVRGDLLDRGGAALMPLGSVYPVQLDPVRATPETAAALETLVGEAPGSLVAKLAAATASGSKATIPVITYRQSDYDARRAALDALVGVIYPRQEQPLALSRGFGQPLLGTFGPVTAEMVEKSGGRYVGGDRAGLSGLQAQYDKELGGVRGVQVVASTGGVLFDRPAVDGADVATTLAPAVQAAAESALAGAGSVPAALVALDVPSGEVLAVANTPADGMNRALTGRYAPGSAFKVASTHAFLTKKLVTPTTEMTCPATITVTGKSFRNFEGGEAGTGTFARNFAISCNTAFISLAASLAPGDLTASAKSLGIGVDWAGRIGVDGTFVGSVPETTPGTDLAAASIGQGRIEVSPLSVAVMAGSVARGSFLPPTLVKEGAGAQPGMEMPLDASVVATLRDLMGKVVTEGSGGALVGAPGGPVAGKTGTAEYGTDVPPKTRAWFTGYQGDLAFAVLVEDGKSGGSVAAPIARAFLDAYRAAPPATP
ncbi:MAG TPA: penicillin-binding transpeptidase domain-containing protein [Phycicoccus sp.]|nr:penicillin-binding transpeptidase domain-containing protein [Phycicoccus sp.]